MCFVKTGVKQRQLISRVGETLPRYNGGTCQRIQAWNATMQHLHEVADASRTQGRPRQQTPKGQLASKDALGEHCVWKARACLSLGKARPTSLYSLRTIIGSLIFLWKKFLHIAWKVWWACENVVGEASGHGRRFGLARRAQLAGLIGTSIRIAHTFHCRARHGEFHEQTDQTIQIDLRHHRNCSL